MTFRYLVYDIETVVDKPMLNRVSYMGLGLSDEDAYAKELEMLNAQEAGRSFVNPSFHQPVAIVGLALDETCAIQKLAVLGEGSLASRVGKFWSVFSESRPVLVDFNGKGFDLRVLELWAYRLGIALPDFYFAKFGPRTRYNLDAHLDLHEFLSNHGAIRFKGGLNLFAKLLGFPGKLDVTGDQVQALYDAGKLFEIEDYCMGDVMDTYFVFLRVQVVRGVLSLDQEKRLIDEARLFMERFAAETGYLKAYIAACTP